MMKNILFLLLFSTTLFAQEEMVTVDSTDSIKNTTTQSIFDFFSEKEIMEFTLEAEFDSIIGNKKFNKNLSGKISYMKGEATKTIGVKVRTRGKYRRKICDFPPLRLKFKKSKLNKMGLHSEFNTLKLVTHCLDDKRVSKENILREFLAYKIYEFHTAHSFRVHLVKVIYKRPGKKKKLYERLGMLIENEDELAARMDGKIYERRSLSLDSLQPYPSTLQAMYQCMISNSDWSVPQMRNVKLVRVNDQEKLSVVPYDFDFSGLVDAPYAIPNPDHKLTDIRQRIFLGKTYSEENLKKIVSLFLKNKEAVLDYCKNFDQLPKSSRKDIIRYLKSFYKILEDEEALQNELLNPIKKY